jgi:hypothetical protein
MSFDNINCKYPLPESTEEIQKVEFQTKHLENTMDRYTITEDGKLIFHKVRYETVPEEERPFYGKPEWEHPFGQICGMLRAIPLGDEEVEYHGVIRIYTIATNKEWFEYEIKFTDGKVENIKRIYREFGEE